MLTNCRVIGANIPTADYLRRDGAAPRGHAQYVMSSSELADFLACPRRWLNGHLAEDDETKSSEWGTLVDLLALQPQRFEEQYAICPATYADEKTGEEKKWNFNAKPCKRWKKETEGKKPVKLDVYTPAENAVRFLFADSRIASLLRASEKQVMVIGEYHDEQTGFVIPLRGLIDIVPDAGGEWANDLADLKTCRNAAPRPWQVQVFRYGYHTQGAFYTDLFNAATGQNRNRFLHVVQESRAPWQVGRRFLSEDFLKLGRDTYQSALRRYCQCLKLNNWPDFDDASTEYGGWSIVYPDAFMFDALAASSEKTKD